MMDNASYNKIKLLHQVSELIWFIEKHALEDAKKAGDTSCIETLKQVHANLEKQLTALEGTLECCKECK